MFDHKNQNSTNLKIFNLQAQRSQRRRPLVRWISYLSVLTLTIITGFSCSDDSTSEKMDESELMIEELRDSLQEYQNFDVAASAGWAVDMSGCVEHPDEGGMGHHFGRPEYIDGRINHLEPQVLLFEPLENGGFEFVGVEYIIPFDIRPSDSEPPSLFDQNYHQNHQLNIWALHVWTEKENPKGMFYDWNPNVSCEYADN